MYFDKGSAVKLSMRSVVSKLKHAQTVVRHVARITKANQNSMTSQNGNDNCRSRNVCNPLSLSLFRIQRTTTVTRSPCTHSPGLSNSLMTQTPVTWPIATPTPIHICSATLGVFLPTQQLRHTVNYGCCAKVSLGMLCIW